MQSDRRTRQWRHLCEERRVTERKKTCSVDGAPLATMSCPGDPFTYYKIEVPTVVGQLRNILTQYPDNGQIIKELVQNAEDAGATTVEVVHVPDHFSFPEAWKVVRKFLQGPAVSLYNDAVFSEEDWHGIRKLSESIKKDNPLQVGQFGLGFKSVFHLTDYLMIISGQLVLFMDPSEPEERMCRCLPLQQLSEVFPTASVQHAFGHHLTPQQQAAGSFPGTLFWFPLRQTPSKISDTVYTAEHVKWLFDSFAVEAGVCLTFLKSLEKITIGQLKSQKVIVSHCMEVTSSNMTRMRNMRQAFRQNLQQCKGSPSQALSCSYDATLHTSNHRDNRRQQDMRILHFLPGKKDTEWIKWGGKDTSKHIPLVGVAVPTSTPAEATGHIFSFLPLPPDSTNQTGLPVQVNGAFILNQNRRQVKWRTSESSKEADVMWNEELVVKVVAKAYTVLLEQLLKEATTGSIDATTWYTFLPDLSAVAGRWLKMGKKVWLDLLTQDIISSEVNGFLAVEDVLSSNDLDALNPPEVANTVKKVLCSQSLPLATLPHHVLQSLCLLDQEPSPVTPRHLRSTLKKCSTLKKWNREHLLFYSAKDGDYGNLLGLPLLPLQDKTWERFRFGGEAVYLCSRKEAEALQGLEGQVVNNNVAPSVLKILQAVADSGATQVCHFQAKQHGPKLLQKSVASMQNRQPTSQDVEQWLAEVWKVLQHVRLPSVEHIPLLPTSQPPQVLDLTSLASPLVQQGSGKLSRPQVEVLSLLGVVVVPALPSYVRHTDLSGYLHSSDCYGTTQALNKAASKKDQTHTASYFNSWKTEEQRQALHSLIDTHSMQPQLKNLLRALSVFEAQDSDNHVADVCLAAVNVIAPEIQDFPVRYPETLLTPSLPEERTLALALGATVLCQSELCVRALRSCYGDEDTSRLVGYILRDRQLAANSTVLQELRNTRFVPSVAGSLCRPTELYDPDDDDRDALIGETQTPGNSFRQHLPLLRSLGLRKLQDTHWRDLVGLIKRHHNTLLSEAQRVKKSAGLLRAVNRHSDCPLICREVRGVPFVFGASRPSEYPTSLQWGTPPGLLKLLDVTSCQHSEVCGSALAVVRCHDVPSVAKACGWTAPPPVDSVVRHLHNIKAAYQQDEWTKYFSLVKKTYCQLAALLAAGAAQLADLKTDACIFTEQGFKTPAEVYIRPGSEDLYLQPYLHLLPLELRESEALFLHLGCAPQQSPALLLMVLQAIRERHQGGDCSRAEVEHDRRLVVSVLERLQHHTGELAGPLLVPVRTQHDVLELAEVQHSAFTDATTDWIDSDELEVSVVHHCVGAALARALGVAPLQNFLSAGGEAVMEWGQQEPLTTRLHNLLQHYRDGVSVLKELVQNADDAGATTVQLLYDQRQNEGSHTLLLGSGMAQCQGPALWAYNDAHFSEQDFINLRKIGAGTKELQPTKIGKFGLGFCSVYNLTDVPSFVSGSSYVVFDPHMTHLDTTTSSPGMRYDFTSRRNSYMLRTLQGQFEPFRDVFGCNIQERGSFPATLFRLPLRTPAQASTSKISDKCYSHQDMVQLLGMFSAVVGQLLLFTQHVCSISVCHLPASAASPTEMVELFCASRSAPGSVPNLVPLPTGGTQSLLERTAALFSQQQQGLMWDGGMLAEGSTAEVRVRNSREGTALCGIEEGEWGTTWVTSWHSGSAKLCCLAEMQQGRALPLAAVAVPACHSDSGWQPQCLADLPPGFYHEGHFHCFLPLPVKTFLPVQVNGVLEVASDRTSLLTQTEDDRHTLSWNATLLGDAAVRAHLGLAEALRHLGLCAGSKYYATWPVVGCGGGPLVEGLATSFYHTLQQEDLELFQCGRGEWHPFSRCYILEEDFLRMPEVGEAAFEFLEACLYSSSEMRMVRLPGHMQAGFDRQVLAWHTITQEMFFQQYFVPHLSEKLVSTEKRDLLTIHLLESGHHYMELLRPLPCIPTQPHGAPRPPCDLVSPKSRIAKMFSVEDERFPLKNFLDPLTRSAALSKLGMSTHTLPPELVVERAQSVAGLARACPECARHRVSELLHYISTQHPQKQRKVAHKLKPVPFLPVMPKPERWSVTWHKECPTGGEPQWCSSHRETTCESHHLPLALECPPALCLPSFRPLVGSFHALLDERLRKPPQEVLEELGVTVNAHNLPLVLVVKQLCEFSTAAVERDNALMCHAIYEHLEDFIMLVRREKILNNIREIKRLRDEKILVTTHGFVAPRLFAVHSESDCAPDLFSARTEGLEKYGCLMDMLGIRENFEFEVVMEVIQKKRETFADGKLADKDVSQVSRLLNVLFHVRDGSAALEQVLHLPDSQGLLRSTQDLCFDDGAELSSSRFLCLHPSISMSRDMSEWLGIKSKTRKRLSESSTRLRFGQKEPLTTRLRNILSEYPCDSGIMKELLQNADDAGATEVTFYKDFRCLPDQKLFDPMWAPLQGPALVVFNNKGFTEQDLQSIQDLGNSSKREDPATTGQYGIGFNAVYHLTDAPSFLTKGPQVPQGETLCMFDPHCLYDPSATPESPGVQFVNLSDLRQDHPDSFTGYLEQHFPHEGTMFRLPLRTVQASLISKEIPKEDDVCKMLKEFEREMSQCLLFLRNVRKVSIKKVQSDGQCEEEYYVQATVTKSSDLPVLTVKHMDAGEARDPCALDMVRTSCIMNIQDSRGSSSQWFVVQQLGVKEKNSLPEIVREAFSLKTLNMLPHGGVAILLASNLTSNGTCLSDVYSTSCYLPLPARSGLPFSINGHFTLNSSRRDLWTGSGDAKGLWNEWLLKELLVPVAVHAIESFRTRLFPCDGDSHMTECDYTRRMRHFHSVLPLAQEVQSKWWQKFVKWFYEWVRQEELHFFDSFIPETDPPPPPPYMRRGEPMQGSRKGRLVWHAFHASGDHFPVYFTSAVKEDVHSQQKIADILRRLGMKVSSNGMLSRLVTADCKFQCPLLTPDVALAFVKSWDQDVRDCCRPQVGNQVSGTPFLKDANVLSVLKYVMRGGDFSVACVDKLPLLVTNDGMLGCFSIQEPVFLSSFCDLLPNFGKEFTLCSHVSVIKGRRDEFKLVVKTFTPADLGERLPHMLDATQCAADARLPLSDRQWLLELWKFVVQYIEEAYCQERQMNWAQAKQYILRTLGKWAFYPITERGQVFVIPIEQAWQVLDVSGHITHFAFRNLPVPVPYSVGSKDHMDGHVVGMVRSYLVFAQDKKPYIPTQLQLAATLKDPAAVLQLLHFHRRSVNLFFQECSQREQGRDVINEILEYLGKHCKECSLSGDKIRALQVFPDLSGQLCTLQDRKLIVLARSFLELNKLEGVCSELGLLVVPKPDSDSVTNLYKYLEPNCLLGELDLYTTVILPSMNLLNERDRMFYLQHLEKNLPRSLQKWNADQHKVIATLRLCPFIELDGTLKTADQFYDPSNKVFCVMGLANLPEAWRESEWHRLLTLAGLVHSVSPDMFVEYASSLSLGDASVKEKSKVLCEYLNIHLEDLQPKILEILDIEFLVPKKCDQLEALLPHHQTHSGLLAFSEGINPKYANIIWSTRSLLPPYATGVARKLQSHCANQMNVESPPAADIVEHILKFCSSMQATPEKSPNVGSVMENIYEHLSQCGGNEMQSLKERDVPIIHIPNHIAFVSISRVVGNLEEEILPYLYKAPVVYGKFFGVFEGLGMPADATPNTYAHVLEMIHECSGQQSLHPEETAQMKMALKGLVKDRYKLKNLTVLELYLPARDETLKSSSQMFVADNAKLLVAVQRAFHKPVFMGFKPLEIDFDDCCLVKLLPKRLQPKFLSEACKETLDQEGMLEEATPLLGEIHELLQSQEFKTGVLRFLHHYKLQGGSGLVKKEKDEVVALLARVTVRQVSTIRTTLTLHDTVVGQQEKNHFVAVNGEGDQRTWTLYLSKKIPPRMIPNSLCEVYAQVLQKWDSCSMREFSDIFACYGKPHYIHSTLEERGIKEYSTDVPERSLFMCHVGTYLEERFLPLLDNSFSEFYKNEIVCMKKYLCENKGADVDDEDAEEDIFVIVEVVKLEEKHPNCHMQNTYQVITSRSPPCLVTVRAHQLYRFVRKDDDASQSKFESREDIFRKLREELRRIWQVEDEQERRHLLRRLKFKWHPDKNPEQVELCTQVMQYMMSLVGRLENGEAIPEEEDPTNPPQATPSRAYSQCFRPPRRCYRNRNRAAPRQPRPDLPEARRWLRQARSDLEAAEAVKEQVPWWTVFMCYQAAEKVLLAALFVQDRELASEKEGEGPLVRTLSGLALLLNSPHAVQLANTIEQRAGGFLEPLYPTFGGCPQDRYTLWDTNQVLPPCRELLQVLSARIG